MSGAVTRGQIRRLELIQRVNGSHGKILSRVHLLPGGGGCVSHKIPWTSWLQATGICFLRVLKSRSPKLRCQQDPGPLEGSRGWAFLFYPSFWGLQAFLGLWPCHSSLFLCLTWPLLWVWVSSLLSLRGTLVIGWRAHPKSRMTSFQVP